MGSITWCALIQCHDYISTYYPLCIYVVFWSKGMFGAVNMGAECATVLCKLSVGSQREDLESAAVCKHRLVPRNEFMQATGLVYYVETRTEIKVIGISQNNLGIDIIPQIPVVYSLYRTYSSYRHKNWRLNHSMVCIK